MGMIDEDSILINHIVHKSQPLQWPIASCLHISIYQRHYGVNHITKKKALYFQLITSHFWASSWVFGWWQLSNFESWWAVPFWIPWSCILVHFIPKKKKNVCDLDQFSKSFQLQLNFLKKNMLCGFTLDMSFL